MRDNCKCYHCNKIINESDTLYRCCDANVCSPHCGENRLKFIQKADPYLISPDSWNNLNILINKKSNNKQNDNFWDTNNYRGSYDYYDTDDDSYEDDDFIKDFSVLTYNLINFVKKVTSIFNV